MLKDMNLQMESQAQLQSTSMYHFTMQTKDTVNVLSFQQHAVHQLFNLLVNFIANL